MHTDVAKAVAYHIASRIVSDLVDDVEDAHIAEVVYSELPGLEDTSQVEAEVKVELSKLKEFLTLRF